MSHCTIDAQAIAEADFLISYTCDVAGTPEQQKALADYVANGGRWFALHGTNSVLEMLADGIQTGRGRRAAYIHRDRIHGVLRGRRGARLAALTSGGAIPETADYRVVSDPDDTFVGTVNEDWAIESMAGDVFLLGSTSWRIRRVESGVVRVSDARGAPPTIPFWLGEAPARTDELSHEVSELRRIVDERLAAGENAIIHNLRYANGWVSGRCAEQRVEDLS